ncbi:serine hydrolase domain-containing protein [Paracoccus laeviglucosivorans]|uniref:CubicO group peptidase, beta-lactamase class C family n=1 Tax=Paracoccus laeviglucosivorans TaxID=1197861 RepID=A0A521CC24_9RHOB|nr:serine hydrolase [Paracoccus laeviglucosivorans]SMO56944.1 CubicO group peptidase, beta-lactamase class C family [Paracoccus laeviglucosivorans]
MQRRSILAGLAALPFAAPRFARAATDTALSDAARLPQLRAIAIWQGREIAARGYGGFTPDRATNIKSASKSIVSALAGIAIARGLFTGPDQRVAEVLRDDLPANPDPRMADLTLGHLLSMQAGLQRQSGPNYGRWVSSRNWVRAALDVPFETDPGGRMLYSTASTHLVSAMLTKVGGKSTLALAREWLALPGFQITAWERDPQGIYLGGNQMAMSTRSLLAFGAAYAAEGQGVIPRDWIAASWRPRTRSFFNGEEYGYGWFISRIGGRPVRYGWGYGGQMIYVFPGQNPVAIAMTSDPDLPSARSGYRETLHALAGELVQGL